MKVSVDSSKCIKCGACVAIASDNFTFGQSGVSEVKSDVVTEETRRAMEACPVYAISIDENNNENVINMEEHKCEHCDDCQCEKEAA